MPKFLTFANVCCNFRLPPYVDVNLFLQPQYGLETSASDHGLWMAVCSLVLHSWGHISNGENGKNGLNPPC